MLRLILVLLLAFASTATPAAAHDGAAPMAMSSHAMNGMDHKAPMPMQHDCIGCMPIADWGGAPISPPFMVAGPALISRIAAMPLLPGQAPTPPPPRRA